MGSTRALCAVLLAAVVALAQSVASGGANPVHASAGEPPASIEGAWILSLPAAGPTAKQLVTFFPGGVVIATNSPSIPPAPDGPPVRLYSTDAHGAWVDLGDRRYAATLVYLLFTEEGANAFSFTAEASYTLDASSNAFSGEYRATVADAAGTVVAQMGPFPIEGTRIRVAAGG